MTKTQSKNKSSASKRVTLPREPIMSGSEFKGLGMTQTAYFRPVQHEGVEMIAIHAADGTPIAIAEDEQSAVDAILKSHLIPSFLH